MVDLVEPGPYQFRHGASQSSAPHIAKSAQSILSTNLRDYCYAAIEKRALTLQLQPKHWNTDLLELKDQVFRSEDGERVYSLAISPWALEDYRTVRGLIRKSAGSWSGLSDALEIVDRWSR